MLSHRGWQHINYRVARDPRHDFAIRVPEHLMPLRVPFDSPEGLTSRQLAIFTSEGEPDLVVEVRCTRVAKELDPLDLLATHLERDGAEVLERKDTSTLAGKVGTLLVERPLKRGRAKTLALVEKDAELVYFVFGHTDAEGFAMHEPTLREIMASFRLLHPQRGLAEDLLFGGGRFPVDHAFLFPRSFELITDPRSNAALAVYELRHKELGARAGTIAVFALVRKEGDDEHTAPIAAWIKQGFAERDIDLGPLELIETVPLAGELPTQGAEGAGVHGGAPAETELVIARHAQAWIALARVTPRREDRPHAWLASRRAFAIVRERFAISPRPEVIP